MPPCAVHSAAFTCASRACAWACVSMRHGGSPQGTFAVSRLSAQQLPAPPSRPSHPVPPQDLHELVQHIIPDASGMPPRPRQASVRAFAARGSTLIVHGACPHIWLAEYTASPQHAEASPGRASHPAPPQTPQELAQHVRPKASGIPPMSTHASCDCVTARDFPVRHGGVPHGVPEASMISMQHSIPPSRRAQEDPPQDPLFPT